MVHLANAWARNGKGHAVGLVTLWSGAEDRYELDEHVERTALDLEVISRSIPQAIANNVRKISGLRRAIGAFRPDVVISFGDAVNVLVLISCAGFGVPIVISERIHPPAHPVGRAWRILRWLTYRFSAALVVPASVSTPWAKARVKRKRVYVIPNPLGPQFTDTANLPAERQPVVLGVGRLTRQKGFDLLLEAFGRVSDRHPEWRLMIIGRGDEEAALRRLASRMVPAGRVTFAGVVPDPERSYRSAAIFALPSRYEGFPNALLEAMACGCAVLAADGPGAVAEIVRDGVDGVLVPVEDVEALAGGLHRLMTDGDERRRLGSRAPEVADRFTLARILGLWDHVITAVRR